MDAARPVRNVYLPGRLDRDEAPLDLSAHETEQTALLQLAEPCSDSTVEYKPASYTKGRRARPYAPGTCATTRLRPGLVDSYAVRRHPRPLRRTPHPRGVRGFLGAVHSKHRTESPGYGAAVELPAVLELLAAVEAGHVTAAQARAAFALFLPHIEECDREVEAFTRHGYG